MSEHKATITWKRNTPDYKYETYERSHTVQFEGGSTLNVSAAKEYLGKAEHANPEELLAAALSSCHMLTFLAVAARSHLTLDSYEDTPVATLDKNAAGKLAVTKVVLRPKAVFSDEVPNADKIAQLHKKAHANCFIANSVSCKVAVEPRS